MPDQIVEQLLIEIKDIKKKLNEKEKRLQELLDNQDSMCNMYTKDMSAKEVTRYSRQIIIPELGLNGQIALKNSKVLVVGAGGLGCPASLYLAGAGIGEITIADYDDVELSNLHRQILHSESDIGSPKTLSASNTLKSINSDIKIIPLNLLADSHTIRDIIQSNKYNVVIDGSDNVATRYLLNDVCVMNNIPLVSGSALKTEGQLTVYHYKGGPCYRCLYPIPPPPNTVTNCGDGGVLGPVPGIIGVLQALQTIKIITNSSGILSERLLLFDGSNSSFHSFKLRTRNAKCDVCGDNPTITDLIDYEQFCGAAAHDKVVNIDILNTKDQIDAKEFSKVINDSVCIDVRPKLEFDMCKLPNTVNFPYSDLEKENKLEDLREFFKKKTSSCDALTVFVVCRRGNDSQRAISYLKRRFSEWPIHYLNVKGGLHEYSRTVDSSFPVY